MAAATNLVFKMPQEPCPLPSLESDEESFVVLGQSLPDSSSDVYGEPMGLSVIAEAKRLINCELEAIEQTKNKSEEKKESLDINKDVSEQNLSQMETSAALPAMPHIDKGAESSQTISIASFTADMSSEEVQNKIAQIIDENVHLKDTVLQNNMSLKSQYGRIVAWQEDVQRVHQSHKEKLLEAKGFIENLKREKENLKRELLNIGDVKNNQDKQIEELKRLLKEKNSVTNEFLVQRSDDNIKEFQLDVANKKIKDLEAELEKLTQEKKKLIDEAAKVANQGEENSKKMIDIKAQLDKMTIENNNRAQEEIKLISQGSQKNEELEPELKKLIEERDCANKKIAELKNEISDINTARTQREEALIMTTNTLKAQLEMQAAGRLEQETNLRTQLAQTQTALTQMEFTRAQAYSQVSQLTSELSLVKDQLHELQSQERPRENDSSHDEVFALTTQLDLYRSDFEEERRAREVIKGEKDRIEEDLQNLQRRNQQLQEEIEMLRGERDYVIYPTSSRPREATAPSAPVSGFKCPKCNFGFNNIQTLETHVNRCLELDDRLP